MSLVKWAFIGLLVLPAGGARGLSPGGGADRLVCGRLSFLSPPRSRACILLQAFRTRNLDVCAAPSARDGMRALHLESPGAAAMLGGILLVFPGFITDLLGAALLRPADSPMGRRTARHGEAAPQATGDLTPTMHRPIMIDLEQPGRSGHDKSPDSTSGSKAGRR